MIYTFEGIYRLGQGAFGTAWKCRTPEDTSYHRKHPIAVFKRIKAEDIGPHTQNEVELLRSCSHDNIVKFLESFNDIYSRDLIIVMEYCDEGALTEHGKNMDKAEHHVCAVILVISFLFTSICKAHTGWTYRRLLL